MSEDPTLTMGKGGKIITIGKVPRTPIKFPLSVHEEEETVVKHFLRDGCNFPL